MIAGAHYVLNTCLDQVHFMAGLLDVEAIKTRIEACLVFEATVLKQGVRQEALRGLYYLFLSGKEMARGDFKAMLGMSDRSATDTLGALVKRACSNRTRRKARCALGCRSAPCGFCFRSCGPRQRRIRQIIEQQTVL